MSFVGIRKAEDRAALLASGLGASDSFVDGWDAGASGISDCASVSALGATGGGAAAGSSACGLGTSDVPVLADFAQG